jgi:DNA-binding transcriptional MerR regulator
MSSAPDAFLSPGEAACRLGISAKALRLYEQRGLIAPVRTGAGWRAYGPNEISRASEIAALRRLGFSLAQVARVLKGDPQGLEASLAAHQAALESRLCQIAGQIEIVGRMRGDLAAGAVPSAGELAQLTTADHAPDVAFELPWPWGGERFELRQVRPITYIVGPLGSGKTRLAQCIAEVLPGAAFVGLERLSGPSPVAPDTRASETLAWLAEEGATPSDALAALVVALEAGDASALVIDMIEQGLDQATQEAVIAHLRRRGPTATPVFLLTRSSTILDLAAVGPDEAIILCPANHAPPTMVAPYPGAPGFEAVATCLAAPEVRARTAGIVAVRPAAA